MSSLGVPHTRLTELTVQLTLSQPGGTDYAHLITNGTPGFSDLPTALIKDKLVLALIYIPNVYTGVLLGWKPE